MKSAARTNELERRGARRWVVTVALVAEVGEGLEVHGYLCDISSSGAYIILDGPSDIGTRVTLCFRIEGSRENPSVRGHVVRFQQLGTRSGIGVAFTDPEPSFSSFVNALGEQTESARLASLSLMRSLRLTLR